MYIVNYQVHIRTMVILFVKTQQDSIKLTITGLFIGFEVKLLCSFVNQYLFSKVNCYPNGNFKENHEKEGNYI